MTALGLEREMVDAAAYGRTVGRFREARIALPTFSDLADPTTIRESVGRALDGIGPDEPHPLNLFRVHWYNGADRRERVEVPEHVVLPKSLTGVDATIAVILGDRFPLIRAHKVLAAYACLAPRIITGRFDPTAQRAVWPSTGNYCRGGVAISRLMGCHGVAVLPEGMSRERFDWLERWVTDPADIVTTPGTESNVKEIYDRCEELARDPQNVIFNQFAEFGNHLVHYFCTGPALERVFEELLNAEPGLQARAFVSASGSAGTLAAGDYLKERLGTKIVAVEALECPTMLYNGFGEHNIQGIGDKHIPFIHNVMNTDVVTAVSDRATDQLDVVFNSEAGRRHLIERSLPEELVESLASFGLSSICNVVAAIKTAKHYSMGPQDLVLTVATDGASLYETERRKSLQSYFADGFDDHRAAAALAEHVLEADTSDLLELTAHDRERIFNLGYFTWVEQRGVPVDEFVARRSQSFWRGLREIVPVWDGLIEEFNSRTGALESL